jgi:hypothetical protein
MHVTARLPAFVVGLGLCFAAPLLASADPIAHLSQVEGTVTLLHRFVPVQAGIGAALVSGDQIVTAVGRAEVTFGDGSVMHLDQHTQIAIVGAARIRLIDGRVSLRTTTAYTAETTSGVVHVLPEGVFELTASADNRDVLVRVVEGHARIESPWGVESVRSTQTAFVSGPTGRPFVSPWIHTQHDAFLVWGNARYLSVMPPPTFLPYAHPTYRQFAYERLLRKARHDRERGDDHARGDVRIRNPRHRDATVSARETPAEVRRDRPTRTERVERPRQPQPTSGREGAAARPSVKMRGARAGAAVRDK